MGEFALVSEITRMFPSEWVLLADPQLAPDLAVQGGTVLSHSMDRDEVYRAARNLRPRHSAMLYTGRLPEDAVVVLCAWHSIQPKA